MHLPLSVHANNTVVNVIRVFEEFEPANTKVGVASQSPNKLKVAQSSVIIVTGCIVTE